MKPDDVNIMNLQLFASETPMGALNNLPKLKVKDGMIYLCDVALTGVQSFNIKHDVNSGRITHFTIEMLVGYEGIF